MKQLPFFLYGTLRPGFLRHDAISYAVKKLIPGVLPGASMRYVPAGGFPYVKESNNKEDKIIGEVCYVSPAYFKNVLADLDAIEGYVEGKDGNLFERKIVTVQTDQGEVECICYLGGFIKELVEGELVPSGDFKDCTDRIQ